MAYTKKIDFSGVPLYNYDMIEEERPYMKLEIDPPMLDLKKKPLCVPQDHYITI